MIDSITITADGKTVTLDPRGSVPADLAADGFTEAVYLTPQAYGRLLSLTTPEDIAGDGFSSAILREIPPPAPPPAWSPPDPEPRLSAEIHDEELAYVRHALRTFAKLGTGVDYIADRYNDQAERLDVHGWDGSVTLRGYDLARARIALSFLAKQMAGKAEHIIALHDRLRDEPR